jgi:hypothetical protein
MNKACRLYRRCRLIMIVAALLALTAQANAAELLSVHTASGRQFTGQLDHRTDARQLWLRSGTYDAYISRPLDWEHVTKIQAGGKIYTGIAMRDALAGGAWPDVNDPFVDSSETLPGPVSGPIRVYAAGTPADVNPLLTGAPPRVASLHIEAFVANWDADVEADGLVVRVYPLDETGAAVPVSGSIEVDLVGQQRYVYTQSVPTAELGRWTSSIAPNDVGPSGAVLRLPFQGIHPEFDTGVGSIGLVHARLVVPGQGVFDDSADAVRIRAYSAFRDRLQQLEGTRFLPHERTGRGITSTGRWP